VHFTAELAPIAKVSQLQRNRETQAVLLGWVIWCGSRSLDVVHFTAELAQIAKVRNASRQVVGRRSIQSCLYG
jgi:hypothetical protein